MFRGSTTRAPFPSARAQDAGYGAAEASAAAECAGGSTTRPRTTSIAPVWPPRPCLERGFVVKWCAGQHFRPRSGAVSQIFPSPNGRLVAELCSGAHTRHQRTKPRAQDAWAGSRVEWCPGRTILPSIAVQVAPASTNFAPTFGPSRGDLRTPGPSGSGRML